MPFRPHLPEDHQTLDGAVIRPLRGRVGFGWRWWVSGIFLTIVCLAVGLMVWATAVDTVRLGEGLPPFTTTLLQPEQLITLVCALGAAFFWLRRQLGWVFAQSLLSALLVVSAIGLFSQFVGVEAGLPGRSGRVLVAGVLLLLTGVVFGLVSHPKLRAAFRVPKRWVGRCVTLGGVIGTLVGVGLLVVG